MSCKQIVPSLPPTLVLYSRFSLVISFIHSNVYVSIPTSQFTHPRPFHPLVSIHLFSMSVSVFLLCKWLNHIALNQEAHFMTNEVHGHMYNTYCITWKMPAEENNEISIKGLE